ncbi:GatB/YqeY domain-containing protein [Patescibacteria group bacterium]
MILSDIQKDIAASLKEKDHVKVETLRFLLSAIRNLAIDKYGAGGEAKLTQDDFDLVVKKQVKSHNESVEAFEKAKRDDLAKKEKAQLVILEGMLPKEMSDDELEIIVKKVIDTGETNFGLLMKEAMQQVSGQAGGKRVLNMLKKLQAQK